MIRLVLGGALALGTLGAGDQYGFTDPPYKYDSEYQACAWPDDGSGQRFRPGYERDKRECRDRGRNEK